MHALRDYGRNLTRNISEARIAVSDIDDATVAIE